MKKKLHIDVYAGLVMLAFAAWWMIEASHFPVVPRRFPMFVGAAFARVAVLIMIGGIRKSKACWAANENPKPVIQLSGFKYTLLGFGLIVLYVVAINYIHFFPATLIFVPVMMLVLRVRKWYQIVLTDLILNGLLWLIFVYELKITLP